jgi:hypothetical protein
MAAAPDTALETTIVRALPPPRQAISLRVQLLEIIERRPAFVKYVEQSKQKGCGR